jgi:outer membrane immunogenic protein
MIKYLVPALLAGCIAVPAAAQSTPASDTPFTGAKVEIVGGYDTLRNGSDVDLPGDGLFDNDGPDGSIDGFAYGVAAGYDYDLGKVVIGIEAELMDTTGAQNSDEFINAPFGYRVNLNRDIYVGARIGAKVTPSTLLYVKAGYTSARVESRFQDQLEDDGIDFRLDNAQSIEGLRVGAGIEQIFGNGLLGIGSNAYTKLEYRYSNYSDLDFDDTIFGDRSFSIDLDRHQVVAAIGVRF